MTERPKPGTRTRINKKYLNSDTMRILLKYGKLVEKYAEVDED